MCDSLAESALKRDWFASSTPVFLSLNLSYHSFGGVLFRSDKRKRRFFILETMAQLCAMKRRHIAAQSTLSSHLHDNVKTG
jgi:hypothetical protein